MTIARPVGEVFEYWRHPSNLPRFMTHLERVDEFEAGGSHWVLKGPVGIRLEWDAETINEVPDKLIGWQSLPGGDVISAGSVRFRPGRGEGTDITVTLQYDPPGGRLGAAMAWLLGNSGANVLREDLGRLKRLLEAY